MEEADKILYKLGYFNADDYKRAEIEGYIEEAAEFMTDSGVPSDMLTSQRAYAVKSIWADLRDKGEDNSIVVKDGMIVALIAQLRKSSGSSS